MGQYLRRAAQSLGGQFSTALRGHHAPRGALGQLAALSNLSKGACSTPSTPQCKGTTATTAKSATREYSSQTSPGDESSSVFTPVRLAQDNLFHPFTNSPVSYIRRRAAYMRQHAYCPHPDHRATRLYHLPGGKEPPSGDMTPAHVDFECPDCGIPVYCTKDHWMDHYEEHLKVCDILRQINEDEHDLCSGRVFTEADMPGPQLEEAVINLTSWDLYMWTRMFNAVDSERAMRQITRMLTYPVTIGSVLHEYSPYRIKSGRLTTEGLKSFSALRYNLHQKQSKSLTVHNLRPIPPPVRVFVVGARAESSLPRPIWEELGQMFGECPLHVILIGPESMANRDQEFPLPKRTATNPFGAIVEVLLPNMKMSTIVDYYHTVHKTGYFAPFDPYFDCFVLFHPGLGHPTSSHEWEETLDLMLETKIPIISTGYTPTDLERDVEWVQKRTGGEFDILVQPGENVFRSQRWDLSDVDPQDISCGNWGVWAFRGKRYEATTKDE